MAFHKIITILILSLFLGAGVETISAKRLTPEKALARALESPGASKVLSGKHPGLKPEYCVFSNSSQSPAVYVFCSKGEGGYLVLSADDCTDPILGYSDDSTFSSPEMPPAMIWWLNEYARQIDNMAIDRPMAATRPEYPSIEPMITTRWNQDAPYNALCPSYDGLQSVTGCVATAMAQIMAYHKWPAQGKGEHQYFYRNDWISLDFSQITYDWENMLDSYAGNAGTEQQRYAVANLMYSCGVSTEMNYSPLQSGAPDALVASALVNYFDYDQGVRYAERDYFGQLEWEDFIYGQLRDHGPVQYSGSSNSGGHSFVCDGYSSDGYFHINWGWGGMSDGYFRLSALNPYSQGIGGSMSGFNFDQAVIANIHRPKAGSKMYLNLMMDQGFFVTPVNANSDVRPGDLLKIGNRIINYSIGTANGTLGIKFTNSETGEIKYGTSSTRFSIPSLGTESSYISGIPSTLRSGNYTITPVMCGSDGVWKDVPVKLSCMQEVVMTLKNGKCTFDAPVLTNILSEDIELLTPVYLGNLFRLKATFVNNGETEFIGKITPTLASGTTPIAKSEPYPVDILPGEKMEIIYTGIFNHFATAEYPDAGSYTLYLVNESTNTIISDGMEVELHPIPQNTVVRATGFSVEGDPECVDKDRIIFNGTIVCDEGYFGRILSVVIFPYEAGNVSSLAHFQTDAIFVGKGDTTDFTVSGVLSPGKPGNRYFAMVFDGQTPLLPAGSEVVFKLDDTSDVNVTETNMSETVKTNIYSLSGIPMIQNLGNEHYMSLLASFPAGIYIVETVDASGERITRRIAKK